MAKASAAAARSSRKGAATSTTVRPKHGSALEKALSVIAAVAAMQHPVSVAELAGRIALPRQTAHRLVRQLQSAGVLSRSLLRDRYTIGPDMVQLARDVLVSSHQRDPSHAVLAELVSEIGETCNVGIFDGHRILYVDRVECDWPLRVQLRPGSHVPVHCSAIGKLLLAHLDPAGREQLVRGLPLERYTPNTITDADTLAHACRVIQEAGYSTNEEEYFTGIIGVAVPIRDPRGNVVAGLAIHAPRLRASLQEMVGHVARLRGAAERLRLLSGVAGIAEGTPASGKNA